MTLAEKRKIKAEEKKLEKEEARAKFRLNQIKPTTNACFNILFVLLSFVCLFPVFYVFMISVSSTDSITKYGYRLFPDTYSTAAYNFLWNGTRNDFNSLIIFRGGHGYGYGAGCAADHNDWLCAFPPELQAQRLLHLDGIHPDDLQWR